MLDLINNRDERPFFLNLWYYTVHTPIQAKPEKIAKYEAKARAFGLDQVETFAEGEYFPCEHKKDQRVKRAAHPIRPGLCGHDREPRRKLGPASSTCSTHSCETENTVVFFTSDNGGLATSESSPTCNAAAGRRQGLDVRRRHPRTLACALARSGHSRQHLSSPR